jgi:REP element-mobilizing transposase RayT
LNEKEIALSVQANKDLSRYVNTLVCISLIFAIWLRQAKLNATLEVRKKARKRFGLCVLNYIVTSNHIHLLLLGRGKGEIARSMQLIAGRTAQEYNRRKDRLAAYWQDY